MNRFSNAMAFFDSDFDSKAATGRLVSAGISILGIALSMCLSAPAGRSEQIGLRAMDAFELEYAADPRISPDGTRVAYERHYADIMSDRRYVNIWVVHADGTGHQNDSSPRWVPRRKETCLYLES